MKFENTTVMNFENAVRGMRNPMNSWDRSDSRHMVKVTLDDTFTESTNRFDMKFDFDDSEIRSDDYKKFLFGANDMKLAQSLIQSGSEHRKFMRQIFVSVDITAPLYWWKDFDTYKVGTVANSQSTMHKLASTPITKDMFEIDDYDETIFSMEQFDNILNTLEQLRLKFKETKDKRYWKELVRFLPESWLQKRTVTMNYENVYSIVHQRLDHKLNEWSGKDNPKLSNLISWAKTLPYAEDLIFFDIKKEK